MKKVILLFLIANSSISFAQQLITEEKFKKEDRPVGYDFIDDTNKLIIHKGRFVGMSKNREVNQLISFDSEGNKTTLLEKGEYMFPSFSNQGKTVCLADYNSLSWEGKKYQILFNGKLSKVFEKDDFYNSRSNDTHQFYFKCDKFKNKDLFMWKRNLNDLKESKVIVEKPNIDRLLCDNCIDFDDDKIPYKIKQTNEGFEIFTVSIRDGLKSAIYFRTIYNNEGLKTNEISYNIELKNDYLTYSSAFAPEYVNSSSRRFVELGISDFQEDKNTKDVYIYGLIGKKGGKSTAFNTPLGYYIMKFNKEGKKIWESINYIDENDDFSRKWNVFYLMKKLIIQNDKLYFFTGSNLFNSAHFLHLAELNKETGKLITSNKHEYDIKKVNIVMNVDPRDRQFFTSYVTDKKEFKNKILDILGYVYYYKNKVFKGYIDSLNTDEKLMFQVAKAEQEDGFWLLETDNEKYYKVLYFKHEE